VTEHTHIVVVNDSPEFLEVMADLLHDHHYAATVIDGDREEAVELVRAAEPDGLIIDLRLGTDGLHGWEVLQQIRSDPELSELPTVICSADIESLNGLQGDVAGMRRVTTLRKPFNIEQLLLSLREVLELEPA
jgi:CheY-like chemotaxis protein